MCELRSKWRLPFESENEVLTIVYQKEESDMPLLLFNTKKSIIKRRITDMRRVFENIKLNNNYLKESYKDYATIRDAKEIILNCLCNDISETNYGDLNFW